jgi:co-chaperonin GroES (HSP10)
MQMKEMYEYPAFKPITRKHPALDHSRIARIRPNRILIRPFHSNGNRASGLWVERSSKHPAFFGHVLGLSSGTDAYTPFPLEVGDHILFHRLSEEHLEELDLEDPEYDGEKGLVSILHVGSIQAVFRPSLVEMRT